MSDQLSATCNSPGAGWNPPAWRIWVSALLPRRWLGSFHAGKSILNDQAAYQAWATEINGLLARLPNDIRQEWLSAMRAHVDVERGLPDGFVASLERNVTGKVIVAVRVAA